MRQQWVLREDPESEVVNTTFVDRDLRTESNLGSLGGTAAHLLPEADGLPWAAGAV